MDPHGVKIPTVAAATGAGQAHSTPLDALGFTPLREEHVILCKVAMKTLWLSQTGSWREHGAQTKAEQRHLGEKLSPGSTLNAVRKALENHRLSMPPASSRGLLDSQWVAFAFLLVNTVGCECTRT